MHVSAFMFLTFDDSLLRRTCEYCTDCEWREERAKEFREQAALVELLCLNSVGHSKLIFLKTS